MLRFHCLPDAEDSHFRYKYKLVNAVYGSEWLLCESQVPHRYTVWTKCRVSYSQVQLSSKSFTLKCQLAC